MIKYFISQSPLDCCGCRSCEQICGTHAITFTRDYEGFLYPKLDKSKCVECGLCEKVCSMDFVEKTLHHEGKAFAFQLLEIGPLLNSSSGGVFYAVATKVISDNGIVYGAAFDEKIVKHKRVDTISALETLMGSKYVQSDTEDTYTQVKKDLINGKSVFYCGTPCQIAGLKLFLRKEYDNLITADLVCHGTPSPKILENTISHIEKRLNAKFVRYSFRDKKVGGWSICSTSIYEKSNKVIYLKYSKEMEAYFNAFMSGHLMRMNCYKCPYARLERTGDITIADYWGVKKYHPEFPNIGKGMSLLICNSEKGEKMLQSLASSNFVQEVDLKQAAESNRNLLLPTPYTKEREVSYKLFYEDYDCFIKKYYRGKSIMNSMKANLIYFIRSNELLFKLVSKSVHTLLK